MKNVLGQEIRTRNRAVVTITPELLLEFLKVPEGGEVVNGHRLTVIEDAIPMTAKALRCGIDEYGNVLIMLEDDNLPETVEGSLLPHLTPTYRREEIS